MGKSNTILNGLRTLLILLGITLSAITGYFVIQYQTKQSQVIPHFAAVLQKKGAEYEQKIATFFNTQEKNATALGTSPELIKALQTIKNSIAQPAAQAKTTSLTQEKNTVPVQPPGEDDTAQTKIDAIPEEVRASEEFKTATLALEQIIKEFMIQTRQSGEFLNVMLATVEGDVLFSLKNPSYVGINLRQKPYAQTDLGYSFARTLMSLAPDISAFYYDEVINKPALYISLPIYTAGIREGILIAQIDHTQVYQMTRNYLELGKTGEFVTAEKIGDKAQIIAPTRLNPHIAFKRSGLEEPGINIPIQDAINAKKGTGFGYDYRKKLVLAFWNYLPNVDWGYDVKIDSDEINTLHIDLKNVVMLLILLTLLLWGIIALSFQSVRNHLRSGLKSISKRVSLRMLSLNMALLLFAFSSLSAVYLYYLLNKSQNQALAHAKSTAQRVRSEAVKNIEHDLENISSMVKGETTYLQEEALNKDDLITNLKRKINEEPTLFAFCVAFKPTKKQDFAPYATRKDGKVVIMQLKDILQKEIQNTNFTTQQWFKEAMEQKKGTWIQPTKELLTGKLVAIYAEPFFDPKDSEHKNPLGVSAAFYAIENLKRFLGNLHIGETGYPTIVNKEGKFVFHPIDKYDSEKNLHTEAQETDNMQLNAIDQRILEGKEGIESYFGLITSRMMWVAYQPIAKIGWSLILRFVEQEITPPEEQAHHQRMWIIIWVVLALLFLANALIAYINRNKLRFFAFIASPIFVIGILAIWSLVKPDIGVKSGVVIYNAIGLDSYVAELTQDARQRHEPEPLLVPTGLFLESWNMSGSAKVDITGTIWQIYNDKAHKGLAREFNLPDATNIRKSNPYKHREKDNITIGSSINATIAESFDFAKFPLDSQRIKIAMDHKDLEKNVLLIPDLDSYSSISPTELPGLDKEFKYYGFTIHRSFFSLEKTKENTDFGVAAYSGISEHIKLNYNIVITRDLMNAVIVFLMPLLVILISLFAIFAVTGRTGKRGAKKTFVSIASYTGLLFALVVLNIALRNQYPSGNVLYLEYFFFYTYLTILVLIVHGAFVQMESYQDLIDEKITPAMKNLFWPVQLMIWFITTVIVFYT